MKQLRKISIVIEETGTDGGHGFNFYMSGDTERLGKIRVDESSPAEYWASELFNLCLRVLEDANVVKSVKSKKQETYQ